MVKVPTSGGECLDMFSNSDYIAHRRKRDGGIQSLTIHLKEVSEKTGDFAAKVGLRKHGEIIGLLHDIGKASQEFKQYIESAVGLINPDEDDYVDAAGLKGKVDHSTAGSQWTYQNLATKGDEGLFVAEVLSLCLASHHSGLLDCISAEGVDKYSRRMAKGEEKTHVKEVLDKISADAKARIIELLQSEELLQTAVNGFNKLRNRRDSKETLSFKCGLLVRFLFSCLIDADRLSTADFEEPGLAKLRRYGEYENWNVLITRLDKKLNGFDSSGINAARQRISQACFNSADKPKGLYQLTVPTGGGRLLRA
jgi:CRISPR-associated endonuclease/helicase Cas3